MKDESFVSAEKAENFGVGATTTTMSDGHEDKTTKHTKTMPSNHSNVQASISYIIMGMLYMQKFVDLLL